MAEDPPMAEDPRMNDAIRNDAIRAALARGGIIDLTTTGRKSGEPRRIEIVFHAIDGRIVISGMPRGEKRAWLANVEADPRVTIHLKQDVVADLSGAARVIVIEEERRALLAHVARAWGRDDLEVMVRDSPLMEVVLDDPATA
jgi:deazaflavin-dependent oxidoreductase (nitroreductase family)